MKTALGKLVRLVVASSLLLSLFVVTSGAAPTRTEPSLASGAQANPGREPLREHSLTAPRAADGPRLLLRAGSFDPLAGELAVPANLRRALALGHAGLRLLQFPGPIRDEWVRAMTEAGLEVVTYLPDYGYLVWGDGAAVERLRAATSLRWSGLYQPFYALHPTLAEPGNLPAEVDVIVQVYDHPGVEQTVESILKEAVAVIHSPWRVLVYQNLSIRIAAARLAWLASLPDVVNVEPRPQYQKMDELQAQIVAGNLNGAGTQPSGPGYLAWLTGTVGFTTTASAYPIVDVTDDGIDNGSTTPLHPDFWAFGDATTFDRLAYNYNWTKDPAADGRAGHGNINASIVAGYNARTGFPYEDADGYNYGLGINPFGRVAGSKVFRNSGSWGTSATNTDLIRNTYALGGRISSNSWGCGYPFCTGDYDADAQEYDALVRDAQPGGGSPGNQEITIVFAAGNDGPSHRTSSPGTAKNVITVGAAENFRPTWTDGCGVGPSGADSAQDIIYFSSRGPTDDGRVKPDIVAPGTHIQGAASQALGYDGTGVCDQYQPAGQTLYAASSGTSHSTPAIAGAASLVYRYIQDHFGGQPPSPALLKAYMINATRYLDGVYAGDNLPSIRQGYGEIALGMAFDGVPRTVVDQSQVFDTSGQSYELQGIVADPTKPLRVTLAWTDAPGPTSGAAYVNNLDLQVTVGGQTYLGNVFSGGTSITGGTADPRDNVESIFLPAGQSGLFTVRIVATNIAGDGLPGNADSTDQDFALVVYNSVSGVGYLSGAVTDGTLGGMLEGATVRAITGTLAYTATTSAAGGYTIAVSPDTYTISAWKYGYTIQTIPGVVVLNTAPTIVNITLTQTSLYSLSGCITDSVTGAPLSTTVSVLGPFGDLVAQTGAPQSTGCYAFTLHGGPYTVTAEARLHQPGAAAVNLIADAQQDFALVATTTDGILWGHVTDLETGAPLVWAIIQATPGSFSTQSGAGGAYEMQLPAGVYTVAVSGPLHDGVTVTDVVVPQSNLVERDFALPLSPAPPPWFIIAKAPSVRQVEVGLPLNYTITVTNAGGPATGVTISDTLPANTQFAWADHGGSLVGGDVVWSGLSMPTSTVVIVSCAVTVTATISGVQIVNSDYRVYANEWPTPTFGAPVTVTTAVWYRAFMPIVFRQVP